MKIKDFAIGAVHGIIFIICCIFGFVMLFTVKTDVKNKLEKNINLTEIYSLATVVTAVDAENDVVECQDYNGNVWEFTGCDDWQVEDIASLILHNNNTDDITDDEILSVTYSGTFES